MATLYPNTIDGTAQLPNVSGTMSLDGTAGGADHALVTTNINTAAIALEKTLGTTAGTSVLSAFVAGQTALPIQSGTLGTTIAKGTINNSVFGTPTLQSPTFNGQGTNSGTMQGGVYGTSQITGGTIGSAVINGTANTITNLGTGMFQTGQFLRLLDNTQNWKIQQGSVLFGTIAGNNAVNQTITFPTPYTIMPIILVSPTGGTGAPTEGAFITAMSDTVGTASFIFRLGNTTSSSSGTMSGNWIAIGY